jgi:hypothetical protein
MSTKLFLNKLKVFYNKRFNKSEQKKSELLKKIRVSGKGDNPFLVRMYAYKNEQIAKIVTNIMSPLRILEYDNKLIRKINPIFQDPEPPKNPLNFRAQYYAPRKFFAGVYIDTYWFNLLIISAMTWVALIALYFDLLRKLIIWIGHLYEKMDFWLFGSK